MKIISNKLLRSFTMLSFINDKCIANNPLNKKRYQGNNSDVKSLTKVFVTVQMDAGKQ